MIFSQDQTSLGTRGMNQSLADIITKLKKPNHFIKLTNLKLNYMT